MRLLLIEDDAETAGYIVKGMRESGHTVDHAPDGREGLYLADGKGYDAIIVDRMLPYIDGLSLIQALRAKGDATPAIFLSALGQVDDRVRGLKAGGDDYVTKPFAFSELLARVDPAERRLMVGDLEIDPLSRSVKRAGKKLDLKPREYLLLEYFARNEGRVVTRTMLLEQVWDYHFDPGTNVIDVHVSRLRRKLDEGFDKPLLHTVRGAGYMLAA